MESTHCYGIKWRKSASQGGEIPGTTPPKRKYTHITFTDVVTILNGIVNFHKISYWSKLSNTNKLFVKSSQGVANPVKKGKKHPLSQSRINIPIPFTGQRGSVDF